MSITDFLFSLEKLLAWLFALLTVVLPQHLLAPLSEAGTPVAAYAAEPQLCVLTSTPPPKLVRAVLPSSDASDGGASTPASKDTDAAAPAAQTKR